MTARRKSKTVIQRFEAKYIPEPMSGCWLWIGCCNVLGYGSFRFGLNARLAHRVSWQIFNGDIPEGLLVLHRCDTPCCVNPEHLFLGTNADNRRDSVRKGRHAHKLTEQQVHQMRLYDSTAEQLAKAYGVHSNTVQQIRARKTWNY